MKKILLVVAIVTMFFATQANAQQYRFGGKAGLNFSNLTGDFDGDARTSFHLGVLAEYQINNQFVIQPELLFSAQGAKADNDNDYKLKLSYLNIPVMFKYYVAPRFNLQAGPQIGFLLDSKVKNDKVEVDLDSDDFKTVDFGLNFGVGYNFTQNIFVEGRYCLGLTDVSDINHVEYKNSVFQISLGYMF